MLLTSVITLFIIVCLVAAIIARLDHKRLTALDAAQNAGPIPMRIEHRPNDRGPVKGDNVLEAYGRA